MYKIQIPKPCHENWNEMIPNEQGAFCAACSKQVIDFTAMTDEELQNYFLQNASERTCGRFKPEQVSRLKIHLPKNILQQKIAGWKKFMVVVMLAFGSMLFGCDVATQTANKEAKTEDIVKPQNFTDTLQILGEIAPTMGTPVEIKLDTIICSGEMPGAVEAPLIADTNNVLLGDVSYIPDTTAKPQPDSVEYDKIFTGNILLETKDDGKMKKPVSDTGKCKDTGYY